MKVQNILLGLCMAGCSLTSCEAQPPLGEDQLKLEKTISLPGVRGRIDHMDVNLKDRVVYVAALGNNTVEAVDIETGKVVHSITGMDEPQGVGYIPQHNELFIANGGTGDCYFYNAATFARTGSVHLLSDADDVRYDSAAGKIYVGYGSGGIAVIDAGSRKQVADISLPAHPEGFQLNRQLNRLFVNLPDAGIIGAVDLKQLKLVEKWPGESLSANFPMALDTARLRIFVGYRHPPAITVLDAKNGRLQNRLSITGDTDDLYYDEQTHRVYVNGGAGFADVFEEQGAEFKQIAHVRTRNGARTSLWIPQYRLWMVAARAAADKGAALLVYRVQ